MARRVGLSTGILHKKIAPVSNEAIAAIRGTGARAIEIACISKERLVKLDGLDPKRGITLKENARLKP